MHTHKLINILSVCSMYVIYNAIFAVKDTCPI